MTFIKNNFEKVKISLKIFFFKLPDTFITSMMQLLIAFSGVMTNIAVVYFILKSNDKSYELGELIKSYDIIFGLMSSSTSIFLTIIIFYFTSNKRRFVFPVLSLLAMIISGTFSLLSVINTRMEPFLSLDYFYVFILPLLLISVLFILIYNYDSIEAKDEYEATNIGNNYREKSVTIYDGKIKKL